VFKWLASLIFLPEYLQICPKASLKLSAGVEFLYLRFSRIAFL